MRSGIISSPLCSRSSANAVSGWGWSSLTSICAGHSQFVVVQFVDLDEGLGIGGDFLAYEHLLDLNAQAQGGRLCLLRRSGLATLAPSGTSSPLAGFEADGSNFPRTSSPKSTCSSSES